MSTPCPASSQVIQGNSGPGTTMIWCDSSKDSGMTKMLHNIVRPGNITEVVTD